MQKRKFVVLRCDERHSRVRRNRVYTNACASPANQCEKAAKNDRSTCSGIDQCDCSSSLCASSNILFPFERITRFSSAHVKRGTYETVRDQCRVCTEHVRFVHLPWMENIESKERRDRCTGKFFYSISCERGDTSESCSTQAILFVVLFLFSAFRCI